MTKKQIIEQLKKIPTDEAKAVWLLSQVEKLDEDYQEFKDLIEDKCQKIINDAFENELGLEKDIKRWAALGQRYETWIERFKGRLCVDECVAEGEARELLQDAKFTIQKLRQEEAAIIRDTAAVRKDMKLMENQIYAWQESEKLKTDSQRKQARKLCEGKNLTKNKVNAIIQEVKKNANRN